MTLYRDIKIDEAIDMWKAGATNEEVAEEMGISEKTARNWKKAYKDKLGTPGKKAPGIDVQKKLAKKPDLEAGELSELIELLEPIATAEWSIKYLESMYVPSKVAPELLYWYMTDFRVHGIKRPADVACLYSVHLFNEYRDIPIITAHKLTVDYVLALLDKNDVMKELIELELRFEPWKSRQHMKMLKDYIKQIDIKSFGRGK